MADILFFLLISYNFIFENLHCLIFKPRIKIADENVSVNITSYDLDRHRDSTPATDRFHLVLLFS